MASEARLVDLYLLTLCDTAMTAPDNLTAWKSGLLGDLLLRTRALFRAGVPEDDGTAEPSARTKVLELLDAGQGASDARQRGIVEGIDPRLLVQLTPRQTVRHVKLVAGARGEPRVALEVRCLPMKGHSELAIVAPDQPGVLASIAGALTANRVDVLGAVLGHVDLPGGPPLQRLLLDVFFVRDLKGEAIPDDDPRWARLAGDLRALLAGQPTTEVAELIARRRPKSGLPARVTPGVATEIKLHDDSTQATIVEVATRDRVGLLHAITQTLADLGLDISLAKIATEGEKVADVFYVTRGGERITDPDERAQLVDALRVAVEET